MSSPRLATLVATRNRILPDWKRPAGAVTLAHATVQRGYVLAAALEGEGQFVDTDLGVAEDEKPIDFELAGEPPQARALSCSATK